MMVNLCLRILDPERNCQHGLAGADRPGKNDVLGLTDILGA
jgi:hypothetical protein